jgi:hypothetical protein
MSDVTAGDPRGRSRSRAIEKRVPSREDGPPHLSEGFEGVLRHNLPSLAEEEVGNLFPPPPTGDKKSLTSLEARLLKRSGDEGWRRPEPTRVSSAVLRNSAQLLPSSL